MFVGPANYMECLSGLLTEEESLDIAVAFWGRGAQDLIQSITSKQTRIICNLLQGGTNPKVIKEICSLAKRSSGQISIKQCDRLHAKVILGSKQVLIGSANFSTNGLGLEDSESAHWLEAGVISKDAAVIAQSRQWFEDLWDSKMVRGITGTDLKAAQEAWDRNRSNRRLPGDPTAEFNLDHFSVAELEDRDAKVLMYRSKIGPEAEEKLEEERPNLIAELPAGNTMFDWWCFETWPTELTTTKPTDYLSIYWGKKGAVRVDGICRMVNRQLDFEYRNKAEGWVDLALGSSTLLNRPFTSKAKKSLKEQLTSCIESVWETGEGGELARTIKLADLARVVKESQTSAGEG